MRNFSMRIPAAHDLQFRRYIGHVTAKEQLQLLVVELGEEQASRALELLSPLAREVAGRRRISRPLPAFVGIGDSGRDDISERVDDLLADGFGG